MNRLTKRFDFIQNYLDALFSEDLHAKRVKPGHSALGVMTERIAGGVDHRPVSGPSARAAEQARHQASRSAVEQSRHRRLGDVWALGGDIVGQGKTIVVAMDWTDFDADDQTTLALNLITNHGRATPLLWLTVLKDELKDRRNDYEDLCLARLAEVSARGRRR